MPEWRIAFPSEPPSDLKIEDNREIPQAIERTDPDALAAAAVLALRAEAELTPKPGLVDRDGCGAHRDLTLTLLLNSAEAIRPGFRAIADAARGRRASVSLREELGALGRQTEREMMELTGGVNTHRGAIWAVGLLVAGAAMAPPGASVEEIAEGAANLARIPDRRMQDRRMHAIGSHGRDAVKLYGGPGAREEACQAFPHVLRVGLPALAASRQKGRSETTSRIDALLAIMARLNDTCLLHRGGPAALKAAHYGAWLALSHGGAGTEAGLLALRSLHRELMSRWASPGGSADLLAATLFMDSLDVCNRDVCNIGVRPGCYDRGCYGSR